jgi:hypothetical protein
MHSDCPTTVPRDPDLETDRSVLMLLTDQPGLWTVEEIARAIGDRVRAVDGVNHLYQDGLIHRLESFVFATRTAARAAELSG